MSIIRQFTYSNNTQINKMIVDQTNNFLWVAFTVDDGTVYIEKKSYSNPSQTYFSLERTVSEVTGMSLDSSNLYVSYSDSTLLGEIISINNPLTSTTEITKPAINEDPVAVEVDGSNLWFLLPGEASGENSSLLLYNTSGTFQETVDLTRSGETVYNARTMTIDDNNEIWIPTYEDPVKVVRVYELSGGSWSFQIDETII